MMTHQCGKYFLSFIAIFSQMSFASEKPLSYPKLVMHGEAYENSCSAKQKQVLTSHIQKNVQHDHRLLQTAIESILCRSYTPQNIRMMINFVDNIVITSYEGTAEEKIVGTSGEKVQILKEVMAEGNAWNATLIFNDSEVKLQYFSSEACVESVKLRHSKNSWLINEIGGACD